ncbi:MAG: hypothetical protein ACOYU2_03880 [Nitrospirota bacterium]
MDPSIPTIITAYGNEDVAISLAIRSGLCKKKPLNFHDEGIFVIKRGGQEI